MCKPATEGGPKFLVVETPHFMYHVSMKIPFYSLCPFKGSGETATYL